MKLLTTTALLSSICSLGLAAEIAFYSVYDAHQGDGCKPIAQLFEVCNNIGFGVCCERRFHDHPFNRPNEHSRVEAVAVESYTHCTKGRTYSATRAGGSCGSIIDDPQFCWRSRCFYKHHPGPIFGGAKALVCDIHDADDGNSTETEDVDAGSVQTNAVVLQGHGFYMNDTVSDDVQNWWADAFANATTPQYEDLPSYVKDTEIAGYQEQENIKKAKRDSNADCEKH